MTKNSAQRMALLANGDSVPLERASAILGHLDSYLSHSDTEWEVVFLLRELCLGKPIDPEQRRALIQEGLLSTDGELEADVRSVVLSAVRGEGRTLSIISPFTNADDRAISSFLISRDYIESMLPEDVAASYLQDHQMKAIRSAELPFDPKTILESFKSKRKKDTPAPPNEPPKSWTDRQASPDDPSDLPPMPG